MSNQPTLELLRRELRHRGLPRRYVERVVGELADHQSDIDSEAAAAGAIVRVDAAHRLGDPAALADHVVETYQRRTFAGRHPVLTFVVAPLPALLAGWAVAYLVMAALGAAWFAAIGYGSMLGSAVAQAGHALLTSLPPAIVAGAFYWLAVRSGRGWRWAAASCGLIALAAMSFSSTMIPPVEPGTGQLRIGFGMSAHMFQALLPLEFALLVLLRLAHQRRSLADA